MNLCGDLDSSAWGTVRAYARAGQLTQARDVVMGHLECSAKDAEQTVMHAVRLEEQAALKRKTTAE